MRWLLVIRRLDWSLQPLRPEIIASSGWMQLAEFPSCQFYKYLFLDPLFLSPAAAIANSVCLLWVVLLKYGFPVFFL